MAEDFSLDGADLTALSNVGVKQERSRLSTLALLDAAAQLVGEVGYERATLAAIAQRAGYSHGLVTRRFGSKESLLFALIERVGRGTPEAGAGESRRGLEAVLGLFDRVLGGWRQSESSMRAYFVLTLTSVVAEPALRERMVDLHRHFRRWLVSEIRYAVDAGELAPQIDAEEFAGSIVASVRGCAFQWVLDPEEFSFETSLAAERRAMEQRFRPFRLRPDDGTDDERGMRV